MEDKIISWTMDDFNVNVSEGNVLGVSCKYCGNPVQFRQPEYSKKPEDVTVEPVHLCPNYPNKE